MRLSKERIRHIAESLAARLQVEGHVVIVGDRKAFIDQIDHAIIEELSVEDRLNAEVRNLLKAYEQDIEQGHVDYQRMFTMVKKKLVQERGIIL
ncbi:MAG TPA: DUF507 family protein [Nitrospiraceae bacterium]|nr:DUF507 family protein [Nitrospiraceae bacterium]